MSTQVAMSAQVDVVKKSYLKLKVFKSKNGGSCSAGLQGPKVFKEFWFVFRALNGGDKILEYHQNERKFQECAAYPKGVLRLRSALAVSYHNPEKKQQFSIELADGSIIFLEAASQPLAREWMNCLNAVLFGKGTGSNGALQYFVEVSVGSRLQYAGPCMLEVKDEDLTVKTKDGTANLVRWKLAHIRSFKAKKDVLTVYSGSRSSTGVGEYYFKTAQSVQITHAIETVVKKLKYEALGSNQQMMIPQHSMSHSTSAPGITRARPFTSERRRPLPPPPPPSHPAPSPIPSPRHSPPPPSTTSEVSIVSSLMAVPDHIPSEFKLEDDESSHAQHRQFIPSFRSPEYSVIAEAATTVGYERLDHGKKSRKSLSPPHQPPPDGYSCLNRSQQSAPTLPMQNSSSHTFRSVSSSPPPPLPRARKSPAKDVDGDGSGYGRLDHGVGVVGQGGGSALQSGEEYGKLDHGVKDVVQDSGDMLQAVEGYSKLGTPSPVMRKKPPPAPAPYKTRSGSPMPKIISDMNALHTKQDGEYSEVSDTAQLPPQPVAGQGGDVYSEVAPSFPKTGAPSKGYGRLNHATGGSNPAGVLQVPGPSNSTPNCTVAVPPRPQSVIDPYASLSDTNIKDITEAMRHDEATAAADNGDYSHLQAVVTTEARLEVDELGYSKPWTSYTVTTTTGVNTTPAPAVNNPSPQNEAKTRNTTSIRYAKRKKAEIDSMYSVVSEPESVFETLYEPLANQGDDQNLPAPPSP